MEARITLNEYADISFLKKLLESLKGVSDFEIIKNSDEEVSDKEYEEKFLELLEKSSRQIDEGKGKEMTKEYLDEIFAKWK